MNESQDMERRHHILVVDDSEEMRQIIVHQLRRAGYRRIREAASAAEAFAVLALEDREAAAVNVDLILMDIVMPGIDGIEGCRRIKEDGRYRDVPVIMVTALGDKGTLQAAFDAGAVDYITKPVDRLELVARVRSSLRLRDEMQRRREREEELVVLSRRLQEANEILSRLSMIDGLTGVSNRRRFDEFLGEEWKRGLRTEQPLALIMADIDHFKAFNDHYGHLAGDDGLKRVARALNGVLKRPADLLARYGGEEFAAILPATNTTGAQAIGEAMRTAVQDLGLPHGFSTAGTVVTVSIGIAAAVPRMGLTAAMLIAAADRALYEAKAGGRNRIVVSPFSLS
ncbi:MAG TPA: diguanylate cyclase [Syntrophales bacterium]|jgi:diguanylate cyclase (GGDEF)-like protein|nr:diguanylate cyclase [Syntrophales bacterium]HON22440.1 diguanylate cyclase [Syntrophales bacterium]HOU78005.1 diguanylate cyclase [Syntrophales bacterium]HPC32202.1 diguanylate cyclase [Syntrophales bacterium]HQG33896.1 diguanylate cyclase [Syntrophales bacterium]